MRRIALLAVLAFALPVSASAQTHLIVGGGLSRPISDFGDAVDSGMHGRVGLHVGIPVFPVSLRGEAELQSYREAVGDDKTNVLSGSLSAVLSLGGIGLWEAATGTLFSGDTIYDGPLLEDVIDDYIATMERLRALPVSVVHGGHEPSFGRKRMIEICDRYLTKWNANPL